MKNSIFWKLIGLLNFLLPSFIRRKYIRKQEFNVLSGNETLKKNLSVRNVRLLDLEMGKYLF